MINPPHHPASFRDPSGFVFQENDLFYRLVQPSYSADYSHLMGSGLYERLVEKQLMLSHHEVDAREWAFIDSYRILLPQQVPFISYPYEWSFEMLQDAALLTLQINRLAMDHGMILKDASGFNIQVMNGRPLLIDTLSFTRYDEKRPWVAYRQFCENFLFPLYLEYFLKVNAQKWLACYPSGIPVEVTAKLLPRKSRFHLGVWLHVYLQQTISSRARSTASAPPFNKNKLLRLLSHLDSIIQHFGKSKSYPTTWRDYYEHTISSGEYLREKENIFRHFIRDIPFRAALDIGSNNGYFSEILAEKGSPVISIDTDSQCIRQLYLTVRKKSTTNLLPLCVDITNPSPAIGFNNLERASFLQRIHTDLIVALALVHHLVLSQNMPLEDLATFLAGITQRYLIIEFVPLADDKARELAENKDQYHSPYDSASFEFQFGRKFTIEKKEVIPGSERVLYLMVKR